jgi:hypothetical protein
MEVLLWQWASQFSENFEIHNLHGPCGPKKNIPCILYENKVIPRQYWFELWTLDRNKERTEVVKATMQKKFIQSSVV